MRPALPWTNGQEYTENGNTYRYNSSNGDWRIVAMGVSSAVSTGTGTLTGQQIVDAIQADSPALRDLILSTVSGVPNNSITAAADGGLFFQRNPIDGGTA